MDKRFLDLIRSEQLPLDLSWDVTGVAEGCHFPPDPTLGADFYRARAREYVDDPDHASWFLGRLYRKLLEAT